jgi:hypothetical protein
LQNFAIEINNDAEGTHIVLAGHATNQVIDWPPGGGFSQLDSSRSSALAT